MPDTSDHPFSERLQQLSSDLRAIDQALKSGIAPDRAFLQEFRHELDNARLTAWTVSELLNALETQKDPETVLSFLAAERLRRSTQILKDLSSDLEQQKIGWQAAGIQNLFVTINTLRSQLRSLLDEAANKTQALVADQEK